MQLMGKSAQGCGNLYYFQVACQKALIQQPLQQSPRQTNPEIQPPIHPSLKPTLFTIVP